MAMKISKLIKVLQETKAEEGDLAIYTPVDRFEEAVEEDDWAEILVGVKWIVGDKKYMTLTVYPIGQEL